MNDARRWSLALRAHAAERATAQQRALSRRVSTLGRCTTCPDLARIQRNLRTKGSIRGLGELTPAQKTLASVGITGAIVAGFFGLLFWAHNRA